VTEAECVLGSSDFVRPRRDEPRGTAPRVSIGLPVYNGERFVAEAIESVLAQTFGDFELIISDNGSTDGTTEIASRFAREDSRVRHLRHSETRGARWNFNTAFEASTGELFVWLASDDSWEPELLERCVAALDEDPGVVLAFSSVAYVDEHSAPLDLTRDLTMRVDSPQSHTRFWDLLMSHHDCLPIFGVMRAEVLRRTPLLPPYAMGDHLLLAELGLHGRFRLIEDQLFRSRLHTNQSIQAFSIWVDHHAYSEWFEASRPGQVRFPQWRVQGDLLRMLGRAPLSTRERVLCLPATLRWAARYRSLLAKDLTIAARAWSRRGASALRGRRTTPLLDEPTGREA
jgi:glycosyltransferase involved in cell wall biosynthesis